MTAKTLRRQAAGKTLLSLACAALVLVLAPCGAAPAWTLDEFEGRRLDYAHWLREGHGWYFIDDDPQYEWVGIVNNALLTLAFGDAEKAWTGNALEQFRTGPAARAFHDQLLWAVRTNAAAADANRAWSCAVEAYLFLKGLFKAAEQREIEDFFRDKAKTYAEARQQRWGHQYVPHAFAALTGYVLSQSTTGTDYKEDIAWLWRYAQEKSYDFGETMGPVEHSGHYIMYTYPAMLYVGAWVNGRNGKLPEEHKSNLKRAVNWVLDVYPPSGFAVTYGTEWFPTIVPRLIEFLHAAAFHLNDGTPENVRLARNAKWLATRMFHFGFEHTAKWKPWPAIAALASPMTLWRYVDDTIPPERPDVGEHGSKVVFGEWGNTYGPGRPVQKPSHMVHRSGWDEDALYLLLDLAPRCGKSMPYANAICDLSFGGEPFTPGHKREQGNAGNQQTWNERIVVEPHGGDRWEAEVAWMHDFPTWSASHTREGTWSRLISFAKQPTHAVVFDFTDAAGAAHWQFVSDPAPAWHDDWVELARHGKRLRVHYPNGLRWHKARHWDDARMGDGNAKNDVWAVDEPGRRLTLSAARTWAVAALPVRGDTAPAAVTAIDPTQDGRAHYPAAVGVKIEGTEATDWHGARRGKGLLEYDTVSTDAELFWAQQAGGKWTVSFVNASQVRLPLSQKPTEVALDGAPLTEGQHWAYSDGVLTATFAARSGTLHVAVAPNGE